MSQPAVFVSHGSPTLLLDHCPARGFLAGLGNELGRPKAVVAISAHWETDEPTVNEVAVNETIHDFYGFPPELYDFRYSAPGDWELADVVGSRLQEAGLPHRVDMERGLDHGAWVPLRLMYPTADIPVVQLSILRNQGPAAHFRLGTTLRGLGDDDILVIGSGNFTHNLRALNWHDIAAIEPEWVSDFAQWMDRALTERRVEELCDYRSQAPHAAHNHPTEDHILPLFVALGASRQDGAVERLHSSATFGALRMDAYAFR